MTQTHGDVPKPFVNHQLMHTSGGTLSSRHRVNRGVYYLRAVVLQRPLFVSTEAASSITYFELACIWLSNLIPLSHPPFNATTATLETLQSILAEPETSRYKGFL